MTAAFLEDLARDMEDPEYRAMHRFLAKRISERDEEEDVD